MPEHKYMNNTTKRLQSADRDIIGVEYALATQGSVMLTNSEHVHTEKTES